MDSDANVDILREKFSLDLNAGENAGQRTREHAHAAVTESLNDRPPKGGVMTLERIHVPVTLVEPKVLVRLHE